MNTQLSFRRVRSKGQTTNEKADLGSEHETVSSQKIKETELAVGNQELNRREFLKLSAIAASGGLATILFLNSLNHLAFASKATNQLLAKPKQLSPQIRLMEHVGTSGPSILDPLSIPQFENQLTGPPPVYQAQVVTSQGKVIRHDYTVAMASFTQQILPPSMNLPTSVWGYKGSGVDAVTGASLGIVQSAPGPTFEAVRGIPIKVEWQNNIASPFMFAVDPTIHWANPNNSPMSSSPFPSYPPGYPNAQSPVPLVTHLHGGENQSYSDGGPNQWFTSDGKHGSAYSTYEKTDSNAAVYYYPNTQQPTTLWYHDHALGVTRLNVSSGLAGFYLIREPNNGIDKVAAMLPTGKYEVPLVIQDRSFNTDGTLFYPSAGSVTSIHPYWTNTFLGNAIIVNGMVWPNMNVDRGQYRFRILNGSNSRFYSLNFSNLMTFTQIGSDGGYLKAPVPLTALTLAPAERVDLIVDFSGLKSGEKVLLQNTALLSPTAAETQTLGQVMQFTANEGQGPAPFNINSVPEPFNLSLLGSAFPTLPKATKQRVLTLYEIASNGSTVEALLDGQNWDSPVSETPELGATEDWLIVNPTMDAHPIHIHLVQFQLVQRQQLSALASYADEWLSINGQPPFNHPTKNVPSLSNYLYTSKTYPQPQEQCWKDTIIVNSGEVVTIRVRFAQQDGSSFPFDATAGPGYVWHCHLLEHEDNEMMRPYKLTSPSSAAIPIAVASAVAGAAVISGAIYYQRKRKRKTSNKENAEQSKRVENDQNKTAEEAKEE